MKQFNTFKSTEQHDDFSKQNFLKEMPDDCSPSQQTVDNIVNYARSLEVFKNNTGEVYFYITN